MANVAPITDFELGEIIQTLFTAGLLDQFSTNSADFEMFKKYKVAPGGARDIRYAIKTARGPGRVQYANIASNGAFPAAHESSMAEGSAVFKVLEATTRIPLTLWNQARLSPAKYAEPLGVELEDTITNIQRRAACDVHGDGTGVIGTVGANAATLDAPNVEFQLSSGRGWAAWFEEGDILVMKEADATASVLAINTNVLPAFWKVISNDRAANKVVLQPLNSSLVPIVAASVDVQAVTGSVFYRYGQPSFPDLTSIVDYGYCSDVMVGLESLLAADGRKVNGLNMTGIYSGTRLNGGAILDTDMFHELLDLAKIRVGAGRYKYQQAMIAPEVNRFLITGAESDRRFQVMEDPVRGGKAFGYQHMEDFVKFGTSEFIRKDRIICLPEGKVGGRNVLELHLAEFEIVRKGSDSDGFQLEPSASGSFNKNLVGFHQGFMATTALHPAACAVLEGFTLS